jgi:16S rRNA (guanine966-N2)-methyltransferase
MSRISGAPKVRVTSGSAGGLWLSLPKSFASRPTQDRVRQAVFSSLGDRVPEARVLDLFAGSGAYGIEALSRGAREAVFVEKDRSCAEAIRKNLQHCHLEGEIAVRAAEAYLEAYEGAPFDLVFLDPPYLKQKRDLASLPWTGLLRKTCHPETLIVWEHDALNSWGGHPGFTVVKARRYGSSGVLYLAAA